ncbi:MAG: GTP-binding protein [Candidatus Woesearchaeota archaeon]
MVDVAGKIKELEDQLRKAQYNKATEHHFGVVKAQIAKLREKLEASTAKKGAGAGFGVRKSGDATVVLLGFPSVGKSTLLNALTGAKSKVAAYEFTTLTVVPGVMKYNQAKIQILDIPGIIEGASAGKGRGKEVLSIVRGADLILILIDALHPEHHRAILKELADAGVRINQTPPDVRITKKARGGIGIGSTVPLALDKKTMEDILRTFRLNNVDVLIRSPVDIDSFIDAVEGNKRYIPALTVITKIDMLGPEKQKEVIEKIKPDLVVSAEQNINMDELRESIFTKLNFIRIYLKEVNKKPDLDVPMIMRKGNTIRNVCMRIHKDFIKKFRFARIWGKSAKFPGQAMRNLDKPLEDGDIVEIHIS